MIKLALIFFLFATSVVAQTNASALYDVHGVGASDILNVRSGPGANYADIGDLAANTKRVDVITLDESGKWGKIRWNGGEGWVSMHYLQRRPPELIHEQEILAGLNCLGTEPFWLMAFNNDNSVIFDDMRAMQWKYRLIWADTASNRDNWPMGFILENIGGQIMGHLHRESCSDGMTDTPYSIRVDMIINTDNLTGMVSGCCTLPVE